MTQSRNDGLLGFDFSDLPTSPTLNTEWIPDPQELIYEAITCYRGEAEDSDDDAAEQIIERLLILLRVNLRLLSEANADKVEAAQSLRWTSDRLFKANPACTLNPEWSLACSLLNRMGY